MIKTFYFVFLLGSLFTSQLNAQQKPAPYVILISFDGFRYDYVKKYDPPNFKAFIQKGAQAESLIPSFPSKTFPNHYTLVTGLVPGHHGLVDNSFYDLNRKSIYGMRDKVKVTDPYYYFGVPLWELAKRNGMKSASYFWVGSEMTLDSRRPDYFFPFDDTVLPESKMSQVITWLEMPEPERPHLITLYFSSPDHESHEFGPNSPEAKGAVMKADSLLGQLMTGLKKIKLPVNVIVVSDHGMRELTARRETFLFTDDLINRKDTSVIMVNGGTQMHLYIKNSHKRDSIYAKLKSQEKFYKVYKSDDFPKRWNYKVPRAGEIVLEVDSNHYLRTGNWEFYQKNMKEGRTFGEHGYDPETLKDVQGIFYAQGPNIKQGLVIPSFQNTNVYPFIAKILGLPTPAIDGKIEVLQELYRK